MFVLHNLIQGNFTDHQNITNPANCVSNELERFDGFTEEEKCFDRLEDSEYLQQCRYYIEVRIFSCEEAALEVQMSVCLCVCVSVCLCV